jgi:hypothetical protein
VDLSSLAPFVKKELYTHRILYLKESTAAISKTPGDKPLENFLDELGLANLLPIFKKEHIDLDVLKTMEDTELKEIGITSFGDRKKILQKMHFSATPTNTPPVAPKDRTTNLATEASPNTIQKSDSPNIEYDVFLSHKQANGADLAQSIKLQMIDLNPDLRIFLDVDDLNNIHNLEVLIIL